MTHNTTPHSEIAVAIDGLSFTHGENSIIENLTLQIEVGDYVGLLGPNGSGKTTLLKLILGLLSPDQGAITVFGRSAGNRAAAAYIGYVPQHSTAQNEFPATVEEVVRSGRTARRGLFGRFSQADQEAVDAAIKKAQLEDLRERNIAQLSGGQRQRVFIARALAGQPRLLILDEPTTGVDVMVQHEFYAFLKKLNEEDGLTILLVSHDIDTVTHETKKIMCVNKTLVCDLPTCDFLGSEHMQTLFGTEKHGTHTTHEHRH